MRTRDLFTTVRTEGGLLPADLLQRIAAGDPDLEGLKPSDYHLAGTERLNEAISRAWNRLLGAWTAFRAAAEKLPQGDLGTAWYRNSSTAAKPTSGASCPTDCACASCATTSA